MRSTGRGAKDKGVCAAGPDDWSEGNAPTTADISRELDVNIRGQRGKRATAKAMAYTSVDALDTRDMVEEGVREAADRVNDAEVCAALQTCRPLSSISL